MLSDFKAFVTRGNVVDLAVAFILGAAFTTIIRSFVDDIIMPPIGLLFGDVDFANLYATLKEGAPAGPYASLAEAQAAGAITMNYGLFINAIVAFVIVAFALFLVVRWAVRLQRPPTAPAAPVTRECPYCFTPVKLEATRCPACTSDLTPAVGAAGA